MATWFWVALGRALGSMARLWLAAAVQTLELLLSGALLWAAGYIQVSVALCLLGVWAGTLPGHG